MNNFIIVLIIILVIFYLFIQKENFDSDNNIDTNQDKSGKLYNYFYQKFMNPYEFPLIKFFSNDIEGK